MRHVRTAARIVLLFNDGNLKSSKIVPLCSCQYFNLLMKIKLGLTVVEVTVTDFT